MNGKGNVFFIFGVHPVLERLKGSPQGVIEVYVIQGRRRPALRSVESAARRLGLPVRHLASLELDRLSMGGRHQGVVAKVVSHVYAGFAELLGGGSSATGRDWVLALDGITDPRNFGALLRTAEGMGVRDVVIPKNCSAGVTPAVVKTSAGAVLHQKIYRVVNLRRAILTLKEKGYWVVGLDAKAEDRVFSRAYPDRLVVVLGSEGSGMRPSIRGACDFLVSIPMQGEISSLNVAVSGGIFLYELLRQKVIR